MRAAARVGTLLAAFAPAFAAALLVAGHAVDVPLADDWSRAVVLGGQLPAAGALAPPAPLPRLAVRAEAVLGGDLRLAMALGFAWVAVSALCVHGLLRRSFPGDPPILYAATFAAATLLFSPVQWEGFLWAARAWSFFPFAVACLVLVVLFRPGGAAPRVWKAGVAVLGVAACVAAVGAPPHAPEGGGPLAFLALLGQPFARTTLLPLERLAPFLGAGSLVVFALGAGVCLADPSVRPRAAPWLVLGGIAVAACVGLAAALGPEAVLFSRWATAPLYVCVASLPLVVLGAEALRPRAPRLRPALEWLPAFAGGVLAVALGLGWLAGWHGMQEWRSARLRARTELVFLERFAPARPERLGGDLPVGALREAARVLERRGQLHPGLAEGRGVAPFAADGALPAASGDVESAWTSDAGVELSGFAWLPRAGRPADGVLVTARGAAGPPRLVAVAELDPLPLPPIPEHDYIYNAARIPGVDERAPWRVRVPAAALPEGGVVHLELFAADAAALRLHELAHRVELRRTPSGTRVRLRSAAP